MSDFYKFSKDTVPKEQRRDIITEMLKSAECVVEFTKTNGDFRSMPCTLDPELLPAIPLSESSKPKKPKKPNDSVISVWCTDIKEWRSFRVDSVISITPKE